MANTNRIELANVNGNYLYRDADGGNSFVLADGEAGQCDAGLWPNEAELVAAFREDYAA